MSYLRNHIEIGKGLSYFRKRISWLNAIFIICLLSFQSLFNFSFAQGEANIWYFGGAWPSGPAAGLDFNGAGPVALTNGATWTGNIRGTSSISDAAGNLLFYTNGKTVYDKNHLVMTNGTGLLGGGGTSGDATQQALIVKRPGSNTIYYIFTLDKQGLGSGLRYSTVDISINTVTSKNTPLYTPSTEKLTAVKHCNGQDVWVITHANNSAVFRVFAVTSAGVNSTSINSTAGTVLSGASEYAGHIKVSPSGAKLAFACFTSENNNGRVEIFDFNNITGVVSNAVAPITFDYPYGVEFSSDGSLLYISELLRKKIFQLEVCAPNIAATKTLVATSVVEVTGLQMGPDGKIYYGKYNASSVGTINNPNVPGVGCGFTDVAVTLAGRLCQQGLPNFVQSYFRSPFQPFSYTLKCLTLTFTPPPTTCANPINLVRWDFGDPGSGAANTSTLLNPSHTYPSSGTYPVRLIINCLDTVEQDVTVNVIPIIPNPSGTNITCNGLTNGQASVSPTGGSSPYTYSWSNSVTGTPLISNLAPGTYSVSIADASGCAITSSVTITQPALLTATTSATPVRCFGESNGQATVTPNGGTIPYTYAWTNSQTTQNISNLAAGGFTVTIKDANGCTAIRNVIITQPTSALTSTVSAPSHVTCFNGNNGAVLVSAGGGTPGYTYNWSNGQSTASVSNLYAGVYSASVTDSKGCISTGSITVTQPLAGMTVTPVPVDVSCYGQSTGSATLSVNGGTLPYSYSWSNGQTSATASNLAANTYSATITDNQGCTITTSVSIGQPATAVTPTVSIVNNVSCFGKSDGELIVSAGGGTSGYTFMWSNSKTTATISGLLIGAYTATVTDAKGCTATATKSITQPNALQANVNSVPVSCYGDNDGVAVFLPSGGTPAYTYQWSTGLTTKTITGQLAGVYSGTVTDLNGCTSTATVTITEPSSALSATLSVANNVSCFNGSNGSVTVINTSGGTPAYTYNWSNTQTSITASGLKAGTHSVTVTDSKGCTFLDEISIVEPTALTPTVSVVNVKCKGSPDGSATAGASGGTIGSGYIYSWSNGQTTATTTGLYAGSYTATVTDANGCTAVEIATITQPSTGITATVTVTGTVSCYGESDGGVIVNASGGSTGPYAYLWWNNETSQTVSGLPAGTYSATVTDDSGCSITASASIAEPLPLVPNGSTIQNVSCYNGNDGITGLTPSGGTSPYYYLWSGGETSPNISGQLSGVYSATVTDFNGCIATTTVGITQPLAPLSATLSVVNDVSCFNGSNGSATISDVKGGTPFYNYSWPNGQTSPTATGLSAGTHTATVTDSKGCTYTNTIVIAQPLSALTATIDIGNNVSCYGGNDGSATISASGGTGAYAFAWNTATAQNTPTATGLGSGNFTAIVTDANGCITTSTISIGQPAPIVINLSPSPNICMGTTATLTTGAIGGTNGYSYNWSAAGEATSSISVTPTTSSVYTVTVTDGNNCSSTSTVTVTVSDPLVINMSALPATLCEGDNAQLSTLVTGGIGGYTYQWQPGNLNTQSVNVSPASNTIYSVSVTNTCGVITGTIDVIVYPLPVVSFTSSDPEGCPEHCVEFTNTTANTSLAAWAFGDGSTSNAISTASHCYPVTGLYSVSLTVTDINGCSNTLGKNDLINVYSEPVADFAATPEKTSVLAPSVNFTDKSIDATTWEWSFGDIINSGSSEQNPQFNYPNPGTYLVQLIVTNIYGCKPDTAWKEIEVLEDYVMYVPNSFTPNEDGLNDIFLPVGMGLEPITYEMFIFDRWGDLIFKTNDINKGWDGRANGGKRVAQIDTYVWKIKVKDFLGNAHSLIGTVHLIR